jgi:translation initiation factor 1 (eIF-1/SUI1)
MSNKKSTSVGKETGKGSKGRPTVAGSARQTRLAAREARVAAGGTVQRGRPSVQGSARQAKLAAQAARIAAGGTIQRGRPATKKVTEVATA